MSEVFQPVCFEFPASFEVTTESAVFTMLYAEGNFVCSDVANLFVYFFTPRRTAVVGEIRGAGIGIVITPFWAQTC